MVKKWIVVIETLGRGIDGERDPTGDTVIDRVTFPHRALGAATRHLASILYQRKFPLAHRFYVVHTDRPDQHYALNTARFHKRGVPDMPMFSKRHYERIAYILRRRVRYSESEAASQIALDLAEMFEEDNPKFNRWRFEYACGLR